MKIAAPRLHLLQETVFLSLRFEVVPYVAAKDCRRQIPIEETRFLPLPKAMTMDKEAALVCSCILVIPLYPPALENECNLNNQEDLQAT